MASREPSQPLRASERARRSAVRADTEAPGAARPYRSAMRWPRLIAAGLAGIALALAVAIGMLLVAHPASQRTSVTFAGLSAGGLFIVALGSW